MRIFYDNGNGGRWMDIRSFTYDYLTLIRRMDGRAVV